MSELEQTIEELEAEVSPELEESKRSKRPSEKGCALQKRWIRSMVKSKMVAHL